MITLPTVSSGYSELYCQSGARRITSRKSGDAKRSGERKLQKKRWCGAESRAGGRGAATERGAGVTDIGVDLAGLLGGRMASAEGGLVPSGMEYGEGCPLSSRLRGLGVSRELPQRGPGQSPGRKRILANFEGQRPLIFVP